MEIFALLAEPVRFRIIEILATGEHTSGQVADVVHFEFGVSWSAVSRHLQVLLESRFVVVRAQGPSRFYRLDDEALVQLDLAVDRLHQLWDARYGWPYRADPMAPERLMTRRPARNRGQRGRSEAPVLSQVNEDNDPWQWLGD